MRMTLLTVGSLLALLGAGCGKTEATLQGGGSTFVYPLMSRWSAEYEKAHHGATIRYLSIGSGQGVDQMLERKMDFGCTDGPMSDSALAKARDDGGEVVHIPMALGAVAPVYNLEGVKEPLRFTGQVLAEIFLGRIKRWNDPALQHLNPDVKLPDLAIGVVHRLDSSGTTYIWTDFLSKVNPEWQAKVGVGKTVVWPCGVAERGNEGVAGFVDATRGAIGYVQLSYGLQEGLQAGLVQNLAGQFVAASPQGVTAAAQNALKTIPDDLRFSINNAPGIESYPISGAVWMVLFAKQPKDKGEAVVQFLDWIMGKGQDYALSMHYAPLPPPLLERAKHKIRVLQF